VINLVRARGSNLWRFLANGKKTIRKNTVVFRGHNIAHSLQDSSKAPSGHQPQGAEAAGASEEDMGINPEKSVAYSMVKTRATRQEHVRLPFRSKKR
jgi:hypothetical protein